MRTYSEQEARERLRPLGNVTVIATDRDRMFAASRLRVQGDLPWGFGTWEEPRSPSRTKPATLDPSVTPNEREEDA